MDTHNNNHVCLTNGMDTGRTIQSSSSPPGHNGDQPSPIGQQGPPSISVILTIRLLMQGKEVGSIIGKRGDHIKIIRDESNAKINISDGSCPERIVTITGNVDTINKAFTMICRKFEDDLHQLPNSVPKPPITFRLIVPATQCGSLIGKGGSKIKEIREATGASIQVASEMLPSSTERAVTISGTAESIITCMHQICQILLESPPKGATIPYRPKPTINPLLIATGAAAAAAAQQPCSTAVLPPELTKIHPLNQLLPGFNPTVLAGSPFPVPPTVLQLPTAPTGHSTLLNPELAITAGITAKHMDNLTSFTGNQIGRLDSDGHGTTQTDGSIAQHSHRAVVACNSGGGADVSVSSVSSTCSHHHRLPSTVSFTSPALLAAAASMVDKNCNQMQANQQHQQQQRAAAMAMAIRPFLQQAASTAIHTTFPLPFLQYSPVTDATGHCEPRQPVSTMQQQPSAAWRHIFNTSGAGQASLGLTGPPLGAGPGSMGVLPFPVLAPVGSSMPITYQQHSQLMAIQQAAANAVSGATGPIVGSVGEKIIKRYTPY